MDRTPMENMPLARYFLHGQKADSVMDGETGIIVACDSRESAELLRDQLNGYEERLDATRAKLADLVRERDEARDKRAHETQHLLNCCAERDKALAASQARVASLSARLREVLHLAGRDTSCAHAFGAPCALCDAAAALAFAPGSLDALRGVCERLFQATLEATRSRCLCDAEPSWSRDKIIARIIGERGKEGGDA